MKKKNSNYSKWIKDDKGILMTPFDDSSTKQLEVFENR